MALSKYLHRHEPEDNSLVADQIYDLIYNYLDDTNMQGWPTTVFAYKKRGPRAYKEAFVNSYEVGFTGVTAIEDVPFIFTNGEYAIIENYHEPLKRSSVLLNRTGIIATLDDSIKAEQDLYFKLTTEEERTNREMNEANEEFDHWMKFNKFDIDYEI